MLCGTPRRRRFITLARAEPVPMHIGPNAERVLLSRKFIAWGRRCNSFFARDLCALIIYSRDRMLVF